MKVSLIVLFGLAVASLLGKRSAATRHFVLAAALLGAAATPALRLVAPAWHASLGTLGTFRAFRAFDTGWSASQIELLDRPHVVLEEPPEGASGAVQPRWSGPFAAVTVGRVLGIVWSGGFGVSLLVLMVGLCRLWWLAARAERVNHGRWAELADDIAQAYGLRRPVALLHSHHPTLLVTWGVVRPKVLLPADALDWPEDRLRIVLGHELAHIRRSDWIVQLAAEVFGAVYWFNPLVWIARRRLRLESEKACDDAVLTTGVEGSTYAAELVDLARTFRTLGAGRQMFLPAAAIARPSSLERRVRAMLNVRLNRDPITRSASIAAGIALVAVTVLVAGFGVSAQAFSTVSGSLVDPFGRVLPGVTLVLSNPQTQSKYEIKSDQAGHYEFVGVPPGHYILTAEYAGFATVKREGVALDGQPFQQNVVMQVGSVQETITVTDGPFSGPAVREYPNLVAKRGQPVECTSAPVGGNIRPPTKIRDVRPTYPTGAAPGQVTLSGLIGADGFMTSVTLVGDADPALTSAAIAAVDQWGFTPTLLDCQPIEVRMKVSVNFVSAK